MKLIIYACFLSMLFSCSALKTIAQENDGGYLIKKIKNKNSWHVIYAQKQDTLYKIIVPKEDQIQDCEKIEVGKYYDLEIKTKWDDAPVINGVKLEPVNYLILGECFDYDAKTQICIEPKKGIYKLYHTDDLNGLCYLK